MGRMVQADPHRVMLGEGQIDLAGEIQILRAKDYDKWINLELFTADWWKKDLNKVARIGIEKMHELLAE
jgi:sugar phosphate isomerase/epimerase